MNVHDYNERLVNFQRAVFYNQNFFSQLNALIDVYAQWPTDKTIDYLTNGLFAEAGEVADVYAKFHRGDYDETERKRRLKKELGDVLFFITRLAHEEGLGMGELADELVTKLDLRYRANRIKGDGSDR